MIDKRLKILSPSEINELYGIPSFNSNERETYYALNKMEYKTMSERGSLASKVHFILQLGFFKATSQFFNCTFDEVKHDVSFILRKYFENARLQVDTISKQTRHTNQILIAKLLKFQTDKSFIQKQLQKMLETKVRLSSNPVFLFHEVLCYSAEHKLMLLGYSSIQKLIGPIIVEEEQRLAELLKKHLSHNDWKLIETTISKDENEYVLTALKRDPKSFKQKQIKEEIKKLNDHEALYKMAINVLPKLNIANQNISYYASLAEHYPIKGTAKNRP